MDLDVREVARLLELPEKQVRRMAQDGELPSYRLGDQYLFNRVELQEWATVHEHRVAPELFAGGGGRPSLTAAIARGGVHHDVPGATREEVLGAVARLPHVPDEVNRDLLRDLLVGREALASTGVGGGVAIPHPRDPLVAHLELPLVLLCFLAQPVDFNAVDGKPVRVLFTLLSPSVKLHLELLARLSYALHDEPFGRLLLAAASQEEILARLHAIEEALP